MYPCLETQYLPEFLDTNFKTMSLSKRTQTLCECDCALGTVDEEIFVVFSILNLSMEFIFILLQKFVILLYRLCEIAG